MKPTLNLLNQLSRRRVVVTGLGLVSPLGIGANHAFKNLIDGKSGISQYVPTMDGMDVNFSSKVAAKVPVVEDNDFGYDPFVREDWIDRGDERSMPPFIQYAMSSAKQAMKDANITTLPEESLDRSGVCFGSGIGSLMDTVTTYTHLASSKYSKVSPFYVPRILTNMAAGHISMHFKLRGPNHSVSTACTTGAHSIGDAMRFIQFGDADLMVAGGTEASLHPLAFAGFSRAKALSSSYNLTPTESSRPFDKDRAGFVIGEGAGALVLESLDHALARGARIYAELKGYGLSGDAHHITAPHESGRGAKLAMNRAIQTSNLNPSDIQYINAHATSTKLGDAIENRAIREIFIKNKDSIAVSSNKGAIGHLLGAAGAVEAIFTILSLHHKILPPTLNLHNVDDEEFDLNYVPLKAQPAPNLKAALSNSFGFGGTNASLCFSTYQ